MPCKYNSGMALVVTLAVVAVVITCVLELNRTVTRQAVAAHQQNDRFLAREKALAGIHFGMAVLVQDAMDTLEDSLQEDWANPETLGLAVEQMGFKPGDIRLRIEDELGKIQMNALIKGFPGHEVNWDQKMIWSKLLEFNRNENPGVNLPDPSQVINCAKDWLDSNDNEAVTGLSGAETDDYLRLGTPYTCTNGPFEHPGELFNLMGVTGELFEFESETVTGIGDLYTVYGLSEKKSRDGKYYYPGRININTARIEVLETLLPEGMSLRAEDLAAYRDQQDRQGTGFVNLLDKGWYERVIEFTEKEKSDFDRVIRYSSHIFSIRATGKENQTRVTLRAVVQREQANGWRCRVLQMVREL